MQSDEREKEKKKREKREEKKLAPSERPYGVPKFHEIFDVAVQPQRAMSGPPPVPPLFPFPRALQDPRVQVLPGPP